MKLFGKISNGYKKIASGIAIVVFLTMLYFALIPGGSMAEMSSVLATSGNPIAQALVKLVDYPQYNATTDVNGNYTLHNATGGDYIPIGTYKISASKRGYYTNTSTVTVIQDSNVIKDFLLTPADITFTPWTATTGGWTTPYVVANKGNANATVNITYYNSADGSNVGNYSMTILPGASKFVFREWTTTTDGSAVMETDQPITVMVDQFNNGQNKFAANEVETIGSNEVFLPWTSTVNGWTTPYVIVNRGTVAAIVNITYYNGTDGTYAGNYSIVINAGASNFVFREWSVAGEGPARIKSSQPISLLVDTFKNSENKFGAYTPSSIADTQIFIPWTATTGGWTTPFMIANQGTTSAVVNISYYEQAGGMLVGNDSVSILPNATVIVYRESSTANGTDGSTILNSTQPIAVLVKQFQNVEGKFESYTPAMVARNTIVIPWTSTTGGWTSPFVIVNRGNAMASVEIKYYNQADGSYVGNYSMTILPGASKFVFREWTTTNTDGSAVVVSNQPITAMEDQFNNGQNKFGASTPLG